MSDAISSNGTGGKKARLAAPPPPPPKKPAKAHDHISIPVEDAIKSVIPTLSHLSEDPVSYQELKCDSTSSSPVQSPVSKSRSNPFDPISDHSSTENPAARSSLQASESSEFSVRPSGPGIALPTTVRSSPYKAPHPPPPLPAISRDVLEDKLSQRSRDDEKSTSSAPAESSSSSSSRRGLLATGDKTNHIYHFTVFSEIWWVLFLFLHIGQFSILLTAGYDGLTSIVMAILVLLVVAIAILVIVSRFYIRKSHLSKARNVRLKGGVCTPSDEADTVPDSAILMVTLACVLEGVTYAVYTAVLAGKHTNLSQPGYYSQGTILQTLRFASIVLLAIHRLFRPANRVDPMRTILELEIVTVCWDAIDGSTLYQLADDLSLSLDVRIAAKALMIFWYLCVGVRTAIMLLTHLSPEHPLYRYILLYPLQLAPQPTVDRSLQGIRLRANIIMIMSIAEFYAAALRITLWVRGQLDTIQQEMMIKNVFFLVAFSGAFDMYTNSIDRNWNTRDLLTWPFLVQYPRREEQMVLCRWAFIISYLLIGILLSLILIEVTPDATKWVANIALDIFLIGIFYFYCQNVHRKSDSHEPQAFCYPRDRFFLFPGRMGIGLGVLLVSSLLLARIPALYYNYQYMADTTELWTYNNAILLVALSLVPMILYSTFWSNAYMLFRKEFTAAPGNYNAIHDPIIQMVSIATVTEGVLDILSCATFMALAPYNLPKQVNGLIVIFAILEVVNGCQSFAFQAVLSGGHDDTPLDLVRWNGYLRIARVIIDSGSILLRVVLWIEFGAVSSVFLVKNLYNLIHTTTHVERWSGVSRYPKESLFTEFVPPQDWYGMTKEEWRVATSETLAAQARAGRSV